MSVEIAPWDEDPAPLLALARAADRPWTERLARRAQRMRPSLTLLAREGRDAVGAATCVVHGDAGAGPLAWVGDVTVRPDRRGRGVGRRLLEEALAFARAHGAASVGLDAPREARAACERLGLRAAGEVARWSRPEGPPAPPAAPQGAVAVYPISSCEVMELHAYDAARFGANRAAALAEPMAERPHQCFVAFERAGGRVAGYALAQEDAVGPLVADAPHAAEWLLYAVEMAGAPREAILSGENLAAQAVFSRAGYARAGSARVRMVAGRDLPGRPGALYATAGRGLG